MAKQRKKEVETVVEKGALSQRSVCMYAEQWERVDLIASKLDMNHQELFRRMVDTVLSDEEFSLMLGIKIYHAIKAGCKFKDLLTVKFSKLIPSNK